MNKYQKILTIVALIIFSAITSSFAAEARNGNWWRAQSKEVKAAYVSGQIDGACVLMAAQRREFQGDATPLTMAGQYFAGVNVHQIVDEMDRFYSDKSNRGIPTTALLFAATLSALQKAKGKTIE